MNRPIVELDQLRSYSARLGTDPRRTQAAGGNTSLKSDGILWIKASGTWLAHALERDIFVPVNQNALLDALASDDPRAETAVDFVDQTRNPLGLRPSIETSVHAAIPHEVVAHVHCVETIALAIQFDSEQQIKARLTGLKDIHWVSIPYRRPGMPLYKAITERRKPDTNVCVLQNHGLVVAGSTVAEVEDRLERVCAALAAPARFAPFADIAALERLIDGTAYRLPAFTDVHALALDPTTRLLARGGSLYPDHVIFLGPGIVEVTTIAAGMAVKLPGWNKGPPPMLVLPEGVVLLGSAPIAADAMAKCLSDVLARVPAHAQLTRLSTEQDYELTNWEAEKYRQSLNVQAHAP